MTDLHTTQQCDDYILAHNGGEVLNRRTKDELCDVVLVHLKHNDHTPYVTWVQNRRDMGCFWGHYAKNINETDFARR